MPTAGVWNFSITAFGSFTFQVTAQSTLAFTTSLEKEKYSSTFENILVPISGNPIKGKKYDLCCSKLLMYSNKCEFKKQSIWCVSFQSLKRCIQKYFGHHDNHYDTI